MKRRILVMLLALCLLAGLLSGCGQAGTQTTEPPAEDTAPATEPAAEETTPETREFTDSTGRTVTVPYEVTKVAISGPLTQVYAIPLVGELMVGVSNYIAEDIALYLPEYISTLPELGQLYGGKGEMDLEALLAADPDVVIDVGDTKDSIAEDMDSLTEQTGIPFVHIDATVETAPEAYRLLGELTGQTEKAEELATWCEETYAMMTDMMAKVNLMADNLAVVPEVVSSGIGNEVDMEQLLVWNPDVIIFAPDTIYDTVADNSTWQQLNAISSGNYYKTPYGPYGWLSSPPSVQRYLGMLWLGALLYPDYCEYDLQTEVTEYYKLFYQCDLTQEMYDNLMEGAMPAD